jgi:hypothetical protein
MARSNQRSPQGSTIIQPSPVEAGAKLGLSFADACGLWLVYGAIDASARARAAGAATYAESFLRTSGRVART